MKAVMADRDGLHIEEVDDPVPSEHEAIVAVEAISLNPGEIKRTVNLSGSSRIGWDLAGRVETSARDGSGPAAGSRVVGILRTGAWAQRVAVPTTALAELPDDVSAVSAVTLPVAGLTALFAVERGGSLIGRRVLITGATGGVGIFAVQLAKVAGADVVATVRRSETSDLLSSLGADEVIVSQDGSEAAAHGPYDLIVDAVGGTGAGELISALAERGHYAVFGSAGGAEVTLSVRDLYSGGRSTSIDGVNVFSELARVPAGRVLERLLRLVAAGRIVPHIEVDEEWTRISDVAQMLMTRSIAGKAVLRVS